jgi:hypothetical protein
MRHINNVKNFNSSSVNIIDEEIDRKKFTDAIIILIKGFIKFEINILNDLFLGIVT